MKQFPLVSIIIPAYNYDKYLKICIEGLLSQTYSNLEIIIVDDGSTDSTSSVVKEFSSSKIRYIYQSNSGPASARNLGIKKSAGDFIVFLDADDLLSQNYIESQLYLLLRNKNCQVAISENKMFSDTNDKGKPIVNGRWKIGKSHFDTHILFFNICPPHSLMYQRSIVELVGGFNTKIKGCEDYEFILRAIASGAKLIYNPETCVFYRQHQLNRSREKGRVYRSDIEMHRMVLDLANQGKLPAYFACAGRYAFIAGMLTTFSRINLEEVETGYILKKILMEELENAIHIPRSFSRIELLYARRLKRNLVAALKNKQNGLRLSNKVKDHFSLFNMIKSYTLLMIGSLTLGQIKNRIDHH